MAEAPLPPDALRRAADALSHAEGGGDAVDAAARVIAESLLDRAEHRAPVVSPSVVDNRLAAGGVTLAAASVSIGRPLEILRSGARNASERALVAVLLAHHLGALLARRDGVHQVRAVLPGLDWLEFDGLYPPYTAARVTLDPDEITRLDDILRAAPVEGPTDAAVAAVRALRGVTAATDPGIASSATLPDGGRLPALPRGDTRGPVVSVACEVEGWRRPWPVRVLLVLCGWAAVGGAVRAVLRLVFARRQPATLSLDGDNLRVVGHSEVLGRTLSTYDVRYPLAALREIRRETRYPALPVALSVFGLAFGAIWGARAVVEGARATYFPLIGIGLGLLAGGIFFDFVVRSLFPGVTGRVRLALRATGARDVVLTDLSEEETDRLLDAVDARADTSPVTDPGEDPPSASGEAPGSPSPATGRPRRPAARRAPAPRA